MRINVKDHDYHSILRDQGNKACHPSSLIIFQGLVNQLTLITYSSRVDADTILRLPLRLLPVGLSSVVVLCKYLTKMHCLDAPLRCTAQMKNMN